MGVITLDWPLAIFCYFHDYYVFNSLLCILIGHLTKLSCPCISTMIQQKVPSGLRKWDDKISPTLPPLWDPNKPVRVPEQPSHHRSQLSSQGATGSLAQLPNMTIITT